MSVLLLLLRAGQQQPGRDAVYVLGRSGNERLFCNCAELMARNGLFGEQASAQVGGPALDDHLCSHPTTRKTDG